MKDTLKLLNPSVAKPFEELFKARREQQAVVDQKFTENVILKLHECFPKFTSVTFMCTLKQEFAFFKFINGVEFSNSFREFDLSVLSDDTKSKIIESELTKEEIQSLQLVFLSLRDIIPAAYFPKTFDEFGILEPITLRSVNFKVENQKVVVSKI